MGIGFVIGNKLSLDMQTIRQRAACNAGAPTLIPRSGRSEKEVATCCGILAREIPRTEEPGGLQSTGSQRVGHDLVTKPETLCEESPSR